MVRPVSFKGFQKGFQGVSLRSFRGFQIFLWELCVCIKYLSLGEHAYTGSGFIALMALSALPPEKQPSACLQCRSCEQVCPQQIKISEVLADFSEKLG